MALPNINDNPLYSVSVPSTGKEVKFRPFLVKEQKILMIAFEAQDENQLVTAMMETVNSCCKDLDSYKLTKIDVDYIFAMIRAKSVGENVTLLSNCKNCNEQISFSFNINDLKMPEIRNRTQTLELSNNLKIVMKVPSYTDIMAIEGYQQELSQSDTISRMVLACVESVQTEDENIIMKDEPLEEKIKFIDYLTIEQFEKLTAFTSDMPGISYDVETVCKNCGSKNTRSLEGIENFF